LLTCGFPKWLCHGTDGSGTDQIVLIVGQQGSLLLAVG